jgi:hypothetical protein
MDYADQIPETDRWSNGGAPTADAVLPPDDETNPESGVDPGEMGASVTHGFLVELAKAMHAAADRERERISAVVADEGAAQVERARTRASIEAEELRRFADEDLKRITEWSASEVERIHREAARQAEERRAALDEYIRQHEAIIDTEIQGVDGALAEYCDTLQQFFLELTASTDPAEIARRAGTLPPPPDLDEVRANARSAAVARLAETTAPEDAPEVEAPLIGVMDPVADRQSGPPDMQMPIDAAAEETSETTGEDASLDAARADVTDDDSAPVLVPAGSSDEAGPASRLLRSLATWTTPDRVDRRVADYYPDEYQAPDKTI